MTMRIVPLNGSQPKLTNEQAREIRDSYTGRYGCQRRLARQYGVSHTCIRNVLRGKTYRHMIRTGEKLDLTSTGRRFEQEILGVLIDELPNCVWRDAETPFCDTY
jgi:hypothetical protein